MGVKSSMTRSGGGRGGMGGAVPRSLSSAIEFDSIRGRQYYPDLPVAGNRVGTVLSFLFHLVFGRRRSCSYS